MNNGGDNGVRFAVDRQGGDERAVDLQFVGLELLKIGQAGIARPKIIDRQPDSKLLEFVDDVEGLTALRDQSGFGQLEFQPLGW